MYMCIARATDHSTPAPASPTNNLTTIKQVHERDKNTEFLCIVLRDLIATRRPDLKLILMSATLQVRVCVFVCGPYIGLDCVDQNKGRTNGCCRR